jgi:3-hydroxyacyl-CoA dehydrogenase
MVDAGIASAEDIDTGMTAGCAHPMGPLALTDLIGLDTAAAVAVSMLRRDEGTVVCTSGSVAAKGGGRRPRSQDGARILLLSLTDRSRGSH